MNKDTEKDETPTPRGGGDISGKSAEPVPRGGGDISGKSAEPVPRGGGDISGKSAVDDDDDVKADRKKE